MKKSTLFTATALFILHFSALSQNDSTRLDLGGVVLKRAFTQSVSIKGEDLEKMPFANLAEAINAWLYGTYTDPSHMTYVVDGNIVSDVNTYSIHDIEEIVLVQNAAAVATIGVAQQQMVLITTRKGKGRSGIQGAAQTFLVHAPNASTNLFHQYYVGGYRNLEKVSFGFSANYLRDIEPGLKVPEGIHYNTPLHLDRWRLNGYFTWRPDEKNTIEVHAGFTPQSIGREITYTNASVSTSPTELHYLTHEHTNLFLPWARWHGEWFPGLKNDLQAGYASELQKGNNWQLSGETAPGADHQYYETHAQTHADHLYIRDRVSYQLQAGGWSFEPSFNASYEHFKDGYSQTQLNESGPNAGPGSGNPGNTTANSFWTGVSANLYLLTPAVDFSYKQMLDIQGGFVANVSHAQANQQGLKRVFPFASAALDLLRLGDAGGNNSLKLFGSYAQRSILTYNDYMLNDLTGTHSVFMTQSGVVSANWPPPLIPGFNNIKNYWDWQTGVRFVSQDNRWQISYHLERLNFATIGVVNVPFNGISYVYAEWKSSQHFLGVNLRVVDMGAFSWQTGLTTTVIRNKTNAVAESYITTIQGEHVKGNNRPSWTGGWTNRVRVKDLSVGVDMLYHFSREVEVPTPNGPSTYYRANTFLLQNVYVGYRLHLPGKTGLEIYADSRGLVRNDKSNVLDQRRYYGLGGKITI